MRERGMKQLKRIPKDRESRSNMQETGKIVGENERKSKEYRGKDDPETDRAAVRKMIRKGRKHSNKQQHKGRYHYGTYW